MGDFAFSIPMCFFFMFDMSEDDLFEILSGYMFLKSQNYRFCSNHGSPKVFCDKGWLVLGVFSAAQAMIYIDQPRKHLLDIVQVPLSDLSRHGHRTSGDVLWCRAQGRS